VTQPFLLTPDLEHIHTEVTQGSDEIPEVEIASPASDPDIPTTDQANALVIERLTQAMAQAAIAVAHVQPAQIAGPAQPQQPPAGGQPGGGGGGGGQLQQPPAGGQPGGGGGSGGGGGGGGRGQPAAGQQAAGQAAAAPPHTEPLKGMIPQIFEGNRKDTE
jgi:hypothetical protein